MLTGKLVRVRHARNKLVPLYLEPGDAALLALAEQLLARLPHVRRAARAARSRRTSPTSSPRGRAGCSPAGWRSCSKTAASSRSTADHPPDELREAVFKPAAPHRAEAAKAGTPFDRNAVLNEVAEPLSLTLTPEQIDRSLFADLKDEQRVQTFDDITPGAPAGPLQRRARAGDPAPLHRDGGAHLGRDAGAVPATVPRGEVPPAHLHDPRDARATRYTLKLDGPLSLFSSTQKYGLQLALFLPALLHCKAFDLKASVRWGARAQGEAVRARPRPTGCGRTSPDFGVYTPPELQMFADSFAAKVKGWVHRRPTRTRSRSPTASGCRTSS